MASSSSLLLTILLISFLALFSFAEPRPELVESHVAAGTQQDLDRGSKPTLNTNGVIDCSGACNFRCSKSSRPNLCKRACGTCCLRCNCVPPGTYGNYNTCPCYAALTTHGGRPKCP